MATAHDKLVSTLSRIEAPVSYFKGLDSEGTVLPENVLVFYRSKGNVHHINDNLHHRFLLLISLKGGGEAIINSFRFHLNPGQGFLVFPHQFHHIKHDVKDINWMMITFEMLSYTHIEKMRNAIFNLTSQNYQYLNLISERYLQVQECGQVVDKQCALLIALLLEHLCQHELLNIKPDRRGKHKIIDAINQFIDANIQHGVTIDQVAQQFGYSESHIRMLYRKAMGLSIGSYIKHMKLRTAQKLLLSDDFTVSGVSEKVGYDSIYAFSRAFKAYVGLSPTDYRKKSSLRAL